MELTCHTCGKIFYRQHDRGIGNKYCCNQCRYLKPKIAHEYNCEYCGKFFIQEGKKIKYCSHVCANLNRFSNLTTKFWSYVLKSHDNINTCWVWTGNTRDGYGRFSIYNIGKKRKHKQAHRFSWELHNGPIPEKLEILHKCDNRPCVNPTHLFLGTILDNMKDRNRKERQARGEKIGKSKLKEEQVREIRKRALAGEVARIVGADYGISNSTVSAIKLGQSWKHVI